MVAQASRRLPGARRRGAPVPGDPRQLGRFGASFLDGQLSPKG